jgi:mono/diheme cytochrome c family protein
VSAGFFAGNAKPAPPAVTETGSPKLDSPVEFARDIKPLLERSCVACHSGERPKGGFQVTAREAFLHGGARGEPVVVPGKSDASPLLRIVQDKVEDMEMPPVGRRDKFPALTRDEAAKLRAWIDQGAAWPVGTTVQVPTR